MANELHGKTGNIGLSGTGCTVSFTSTAGGALPAFGSITPATSGVGYNVGDVLNVTAGTGAVTVGSVNATGGITAFSAATAGAGYGTSLAQTQSTNVASTTNVVTGMSGWSIKFKQAASEVTNFSDLGAKRFIQGLTDWSGSFSGAKTGAPINPTAGVYTGVFNESATSTQKWVGQIIITGVDPKVDSKNVVEYSYSFQGSGALTWPTA